MFSFRCHHTRRDTKTFGKHKRKQVKNVLFSLAFIYVATQGPIYICGFIDHKTNLFLFRVRRQRKPRALVLWTFEFTYKQTIGLELSVRLFTFQIGRWAWPAIVAWHWLIVRVIGTWRDRILVLVVITGNNRSVDYLNNLSRSKWLILSTCVEKMCFLYPQNCRYRCNANRRLCFRFSSFIKIFSIFALHGCKLKINGGGLSHTQKSFRAQVDYHYMYVCWGHSTVCECVP